MVAPVTKFWRRDEPELDEFGRIVKGGMWDHQREWWAMDTFIRLLVGGYGSGKTNPLCKRMIELALYNAPVPVAVVSPTFPMARQTVVRTLVELLAGKERLLPGAFTWRHNRTSHEFFLKYRDREGTIIYYSGDNPDALKGPNLAAVGFDEPFIQPYESFVQMLARIRHPKAKRMEINLTGTPEQLNWGYELAEGDLREQHDVGVVHASTKSNKALSPAYYERLENTFDDKAIGAYLEGQFVNLAAGLVFHAFDADRHVVDTEKPDNAVPFVGMDFNVNPMAFCVGWRQVDETGQTKRIHFEREYEVPNSDTQDACIVVKQDYPTVRDCYPDPSCKQRSTSAPGGKTDASFIRDAGMIVHAPSKAWPLRDSFNAVNGAFKHDRLTVAPACKKLKRYLRTFSHELMNRQEDLKHLLDAMRYPVTYLMPVGKTAVQSEVFF